MRGTQPGDEVEVELRGIIPAYAGTPIACRILSAPAGIIPAYAGNTARYRNLRKLYWDHPRVCGEHRPVSESAQTLLGSSPRMREHRQHGLHGRHQVDHPRVCGEHHMPFPQQSGPAGSSPRMRGTLNYPSGDAEAAGIIPAYAGNTSIEHRKRRWNWDHPRVCGEHTPSARSSPLPRDHPRVCGEHMVSRSLAMASLGSSPRMRGTRQARFG